MIKNVLKTLGSLRTALVAGVGVPFLLAVSAYAQESAATQQTTGALPETGPGPAGGQATTERVVVTGSYIPTAEEVTASPLDTLTVREVERSGNQDVLSVLQKRNPDFVGGGNIGNTNANISSGNTLGGSTVTIRGLPTLVLFNNRRISDSAAIAVGGAQFQDVNLFPTSLISRIEVLKDGASAQYGSDAVGGVVNIFLKQDFTGVEIGARYGFSVESGVAERRASVIAGVGNDTTHVTVGFQYLEEDGLFTRERGYSSPPRGLLAGATTTYGGVGRDNFGGATSFYLLNGVDPQQPLGTAGLNSPFDAPGVTPGGVPPPAGTGETNEGQYAQIPQAYTQVPGSVITGYNLSLLPTSTLDFSNTNGYGAFSHQIFGKQLELFGDFLYAHNHNESDLNAQPLSNGTGVVIPAGRVGSNDDLTSDEYVPGETNTIYNPFQVQIDSSTLSGDARLFANNRYQTNPRRFTNDSNFYRFLGGLRSQINENWTAEAATYYSKYQIDAVTANLVNANQLNAMIAGTATDFAGNLIPAFDFFARNPVGTSPGQVSQDQFNTIFGNNIRKLDSYQEVFDARVTGFPFKLPGGPLGIAFGGEYRLEGFKVQDSPEIFVGSVPIQEINAGRSIQSAFAELSIPIVGSDQKIPGIYSLELSLAGRYDHYEGVKQDAKVPKVSLRYQPIKDLTLRATYSNSFVAPTLYQLVGPSATGFSDSIALFDPRVGDFVVQDQAQVQTGSNPNLEPATSESYTAGIIYSPSYVPGLTVSVDYFRVLEQKIVGTIGGTTILNDVNNLGSASIYYPQVHLNSFNGPLTDPAPFSLIDNLASVFYTDTNVNIGAQRIEGFDASVRYNLDLQRFGQLELGASSVVFTKQDVRRLPTTPYYNISGLVGTEFFVGASPDYKVTFFAEYRFSGASLGFNANYIPELKNTVGLDPETTDQSTLTDVEDYITVDGRLSYTFKGRTVAAAATDTKDAKSMVDSKGAAMNTSAAGAETMSPVQKLLDGLIVTVGCNNILDEDPRLIEGANSATNLSIYDPYGRFVYFEVTKKF